MEYGYGSQNLDITISILSFNVRLVYFIHALIRYNILSNFVVRW